MPRIRTYSELSRLRTFEERYEYLRLGGIVGERTLGGVSQDFYHSYEWSEARRYVLLRDNGCDLGIPGHDIFEGAHVHHMNPITIEDIVHGNMDILDPEYLITVTLETHNAIHYGAELHGPVGFIERRPGDTKLW